MIDEEKEFIQDPLAHEAEKYNKWIVRVKENFANFWEQCLNKFKVILHIGGSN